MLIKSENHLWNNRFGLNYQMGLALQLVKKCTSVNAVFLVLSLVFGDFTQIIQKTL